MSKDNKIYVHNMKDSAMKTMLITGIDGKVKDCRLMGTIKDNSVINTGLA